MCAEVSHFGPVFMMKGFSQRDVNEMQGVAAKECIACRFLLSVNTYWVFCVSLIFVPPRLLLQTETCNWAHAAFARL